MINRKNVFIAAIISFVLSVVAYRENSTMSYMVTDLAYYASIIFALTWVAMMLTGKGKRTKESDK